jgi:UDP-N-acetylmuramoylalanine--D-glutamate ligase
LRHQDQFQGKNILVVGMAKSGYTAATLLHRLGAHVVVNDKKPLEENIQAQELEQLGIEVICGHHPLELLNRSFDFIVKNPGIPYENPLIETAVTRDIPVITEVELAGRISEANFIAITGSNGKTTTTTLITEMLKGGQKKPLAAGNIGTVASEVAQYATKDHIIVVELSSFQLLGVQTFHPKISILLNLFDAHLDYHGTKKAYKQAKAKIFENQTNADYCIYNADDAEVAQLVEKAKGKKVPFSATARVKQGAYVKDGMLYFVEEPITAVDKIVLPGSHNLENIAASVSAAKLCGIPNNEIAKVLQTFQGVKHRVQYVAAINGTKFYNDSKATNTLATQKAIEAFDQPVILLAGGLDRGNDFESLLPYFKKIKALVTFGQTAPKLIDTAHRAGMKLIKHVDNVEHAVPVAYELSQAGDIILLSPACASWDQYKTFEQRGDIFINSVHKLK